MIDRHEHLASWAIVLGSALALLGVLQSEPWVTLLGIGCSSASATAALLWKRNQLTAHSAGVSIEGLNLDSLHVANLRRRLNTSLTVERAFHVAIIDGTDLTVAWQYDGFCRSQCENSIEFSIDSENNVAFDDLDCFAFDLQNDPVRLHQIRPTLVGSDGVSKKISVSFLQPLAFQQRFSVLLNCNLRGCITSGVQYYTSSLSFDQRSIESASVHLIFVKCRPEWVRVYECAKSGAMTFVGALRPFRDDGATCECVDMVQNLPGQSVRVYVYDLPAVRAAALSHRPTQQHHAR
jgi:hypothetical protein